MIVEAYDRTMQKKIGEGLFTAMDNQIDAGAGTVRCKAIIKAPEDIALLTNMSLNIRVRMEAKHAVTLLPLQAVQYRGQGSFVYLIRENKRVTVQPVIVGAVDRGLAEIKAGMGPGGALIRNPPDDLIKAGVVPGDTVALDPPYNLKEGSAVRCWPAWEKSR